jgi:FkbM family methyltransferase
VTAKEFKTQVLQLFYQDMHRLEQNNYSYRRFSYDGVDRSTLFDVGKHVMFMDWFSETYADVYRAWTRLADQASRDLYVDLIRFKLAGHLHVRIRTAVHGLGAEADRCRQAFNASPSSLALSGMFGQLVHYSGTWGGVAYEADAVPDGLLAALVNRQYYFERGDVRIQPEFADHVVDAGAFTGEVSIVFSKSVGPNGRIYAFDPVENHIEVCKLNFSRPGYENIVLFPFAVGERSIEAPTVRTSEYNPGYRPSASNVPIATRRIDDLVIDREITRIDFLKMDVEGSEMAALRGAEASIRRFRPKLALSIYHKPNDFFDIIDFVHGLGLGYALFVDQHTIYEEETILYAKVL